MRILYGITKSNFGGAQRYVYELAREAKGLGHEVSVLCGGRGALVEKLNKEKIGVVSLDKLERDISFTKEFLAFFQILRILKEEKPDVFHINSSKMGGVGVVAGRLAGIEKVIFTAHGWAFNEPRPWWQKVIIKFFHWVTIMFTHKTICVSEKTRKDIERWPFIKNKLVVIRNGLKEFEFTPAKPRESLVVGSTSELHRIKGLDVLLKAWSKFIKAHEGQLILFNDGEERENLENMASDLGISDSVIFMGFVDNARAHLLDFDIFCMPSRSEALPYGLLEAGLAKLPVIATLVGGIPEIIENGINGILVPAEDSEVLFSSLVLLADDKELRERLGTNLSATIKEKYSIEKMFKETFALY